MLYVVVWLLSLITPPWCTWGGVDHPTTKPVQNSFYTKINLIFWKYLGGEGPGPMGTTPTGCSPPSPHGLYAYERVTKSSVLIEILFHIRNVICDIWYHTVLPATHDKWTHPNLTPARRRCLVWLPRRIEGWVDLIVCKTGVCVNELAWISWVT